MRQKFIDKDVMRDTAKAILATFKMLGYLRSYKHKVIWYIGLTCIISIPPLVTPRLIQMIIDVAYPTRNYMLLVWICVGLVLLAIINSICWSIATYISTYLANMVRYRLTKKIFQAINSLSLRTIESLGKGVFLERTQRDVMSISHNLSSILSRVASFIVTFLIALGIIWTTSVWLCLIVLAIIPVNYIIVLFLARTLRKLALNEREVAEDMSTFADETIAGFRDAKVFGFNIAMGNNLRKYLREFVWLGFANWRANTFWGQANSLATGAWGILILYLGWYLVFTNRLALGQAVALGMYISLLFKPFQWLSESYGIIMSISVSSDRVLTILNEAQQAKAVETLPSLSHGINSIELKDVSFSYDGDEGQPNRRYALSNINLCLEKGTTVAIVGPNGSGKSTLLRLLSGLDNQYTGDILINGQNFRNIAPNSYVNQVSCALQNPYFFTGPICSNIIPSHHSERYKKSHEYLYVLGAQKMVDSLPEGYNTIIGAGGISFSAGQQQILSLARALAKPCSLLLLDEVTANVDQENQNNLIRGLVKTQTNNRITLFVTHNLGLIKQSWVDRVIYLSEGRIIGDKIPGIGSQLSSNLMHK